MKKKNVSSYLNFFCRFFLLSLFFIGFMGPHQSWAKSKELSFAGLAGPKAEIYSDVYEPWFNEIDKRTNGRFKVKIYPSQTLAKAPDVYNAVTNGIADISWCPNAVTPGRFLLSSVMALPFLSPNTFVGSQVLNDLYQKFPQIKAEYKDVHVLYLWVSFSYELHTKEPIRKLEDIKGKKIAAQAGARDVLEALGAVPVIMPASKIYEALQKGVADGAAIGWAAVPAWRLNEVVKYHTRVSLTGLPFWSAMNLNRWNGFPKDIQQAIMDVTNEREPYTCSRVLTDITVARGIKEAKKLGHEFIEISDEEESRWKATGKPYWDRWVEKMENKGLPGRAVLEEAIRLVKKYDK